jgi:lysozyme family protein
MPALTQQFADEYQQLFDSCSIKPAKFADVDRCIQLIVSKRPHYDVVEEAVGVPWYFVGIVHNLEGACNMNVHLHNGDPLTARTTHVPAGRPRSGNPPFTWSASAIDALKLKSLESWTDWSIAGLLFQLERYNGFGYRRFGINSPYLWSFSNHYTKGKFVEDGIYNDRAVSKQVGAAVLLRRLSERQIAVMGKLDTISQIKALGATVAFAPKKFNRSAEQLQRLLNRVGLPIRIDGFAGRMTSDAYFSISGQFLRGDTR